MARNRGVPLWRALGFYLLVPGLLAFDWVAFGYLLGTDYVVTLVAGAPAREHVRHPEKRMIGVVGRRLPAREAVASLGTGRFRRLHVYETGIEGSPKLTPDDERILEEARETDEEGVVDLTFGRNPFATTRTLAGLVVFVLDRFV